MSTHVIIGVLGWVSLVHHVVLCACVHAAPQHDVSALPQRDVGMSNIPAALQDPGSGCARCGSKLHPTQVCSHPPLVNTYS